MQRLPFDDIQQREHEYENLGQLEDRTDEACRWITEVPAFQDWLTGQDAQSLVLLGPLGFGKTFTIAYVVQYLKSGDGASASNTPTGSESQSRRNVYSYYCKDDGTAKQALNALRSLLSQLREDYNHLYLDWMRGQKQHGPTSNPSRLKDMLIDLVAILPQPTFFIIDALDEYPLRERKVLLDFLEQVCNQTTSTRVLTSARASNLDVSEKLFPKGAEPICSWELRLPQRDRCIAEFLVKRHLKHVSEDPDVHRLLVEKLTSEMKGCAIWARMTLEYLGTRKCTSADTLQSYLEKNEIPEPLTELYLGVFESVTDGDRVSKWLLARSLALIAGAQKPLAFDELVYALGLYTPPSKGGVSRTAKDLAELKRNLTKEINETWIRQLLRPFADLNKPITALPLSRDLKPKVGFVHQSLKDAVLEFPPLTNAALSTVGGGIPGVMLKTCMDYLMLDDFNWPESIPDDEGNVPVLSQDHRKMREDHRKMREDHRKIYKKTWQDHQKMSGKPKLIAGAEDEHGSAFSGSSLTEPPVSSNTDPFGAFFDYAADFWTYHLHSAPVDFRLDDVLELASPFSPRRRAWTRGFPWFESDSRQPRSLEVYHNLKFLVQFGRVSMLEQLLDRLAQNGDGDRSFIVDAAGVAIRYCNIGHFRALMNHRSTAKAMLTVEMLGTFARHWLSLPVDDREEWAKLITGLFDTLASSDTIPPPNYLLDMACDGGCMPVIEKIFELAKADPAVQEKVMQPTDGMGPLGKAFQWGDVAILRYLCQQDGIKAHASNRGEHGENILGCGYQTTVEATQLLLDNFPWLLSEGGGGDEALIQIIKNSDWFLERHLEKIAKFILQHPQATFGGNVDKYLAEAVRARNPEMCRMLIVDAHANAQTVVKGSSSGQLELMEHCLKDRPPGTHELFHLLDEEALKAITACLSEEVLQTITAAPETGNE